MLGESWEGVVGESGKGIFQEWGRGLRKLRMGYLGRFGGGWGDWGRSSWGD